MERYQLPVAGGCIRTWGQSHANPLIPSPSPPCTGEKGAILLHKASVQQEGGEKSPQTLNVLVASYHLKTNWVISPIARFVFVLALMVITQVAAAQDNLPTNPVTADDVNAVAQDMYCPVCENIPLDVCPTAACQQWREEIRAQLEQDQTPDQIKTSFVARYGDRVVGTPEDPTLRAFSLVTPWLVGIIAVLVAATTVVRWRRNRIVPTAPVAATPASLTDDDYRARLEQDLLARR